MKRIYLFVFVLASCISASAQTDTLFGYLNKFNYKCAEQDAMYYTKAYPINNLWHRQKFLIATNRLKEEADFSDKDCKKYHGTYHEYTDSGKVYADFYFQNERMMYGTYYHNNGKKAGYAEYDTVKRDIIKKQGWDENGNEIADYIFYKSAEFPGKTQGWRIFMQKNLKSNVPILNKANNGRYTVVLGFFVETDGSLSDITVLEDPGYGTAKEALRVMQLSKNWVPGIENNKPKRMLFRQPVIFQVSD